MLEIHQLKKIKIKEVNHLNNLVIMMIMGKFLLILIKMEPLNGCVLNSLLLNKIHKWLALDSYKTMKIKEPIDSNKETQVPIIQVHKFIPCNKF